MTCCTSCGAERWWIPYNKADLSTGRLRCCDDCADALRPKRDEDGEWTITLDFDDDGDDGRAS